MMMRPISLISPQFHPRLLQISSLAFLPLPQNFPISLKPFSNPIPYAKFTLKSNENQIHNTPTTTQDDGIPVEYVKTLVKFKSRHNFIRVMEVSRKADHPLAGSRLLLLDGPGNIHSIYFRLKIFTEAYFDVFATLPPILPPGPLGVLGFGAGSTAHLILELYPRGVIHGWELDPSVISVGREYFDISKLENDHPDRLFIYTGNALNASVKGGFSGILVDLFDKGCLIPELQDPYTWMKLKKSLRKGGKIMVNVGGSCVEAEDSRRDGRVIMEDTLKAMHVVFPGELFVLRLGNGKSDSSIALTVKHRNKHLSLKEALLIIRRGSFPWVFNYCDEYSDVRFNSISGHVIKLDPGNTFIRKQWDCFHTMISQLTEGHAWK